MKLEDIDRLVAIERDLLPKAEHDINAAKKSKQELENEAHVLKKALCSELKKEPDITVWATSSPDIVVEGRHREQAITVLDVTRHTNTTD